MGYDEALIQRYALRFNQDVLSGWKIGLKGKQRIGRKLLDREPPANLTGESLRDWYAGYDGAIRFISSRFTFFQGKSLGGEITIKRKGWVSRWPVVNAMQKRGAIGEVNVYYSEDGNIIRSHNCLI